MPRSDDPYQPLIESCLDAEPRITVKAIARLIEWPLSLSALKARVRKIRGPILLDPPVDSFEPAVRALLAERPTMSLRRVAAAVDWPHGLTTLQVRLTEWRRDYVDPTNRPRLVAQVTSDYYNRKMTVRNIAECHGLAYSTTRILIAEGSEGIPLFRKQGGAKQPTRECPHVKEKG